MRVRRPASRSSATSSRTNGCGGGSRAHLIATLRAGAGRHRPRPARDDDGAGDPRRAAVHTPVVATVRDYWPVCYWSDLIYDPSQSRLCAACSVTMMTRCVRPRAGAAAIAAWPLIPYMRANLATKRSTLARASAVIAVSTAIARDLRDARAGAPARRSTRFPIRST